MMGRVMLHAVLFIAFLATTELLASAPTNLLADAEADYLAGEYAQAEKKLKQLEAIERKSGFSPAEERWRYFRLGARLGAAYGRRDDVRLWLKRLHDDGGKFELDPYIDPPLLKAEWDRLGTVQVKKAPEPKPEEPPKITLGDKETKAKAQSFAIYIPFGIGNFTHDQYANGGVFLMLDLMALHYALSPTGYLDDGTDDGNTNKYQARLISRLTLPAAVYGYELMSVLPKLREYDSARASQVEFVLGLMPFGVPQIRNNQVMKGVFFGLAQALSLAAISQSGKQAHIIGWVAFPLAYAFGVYDGWINENTTSTARTWNIGVQPMLAHDKAEEIGFGLNWSWRF